VRDERITAVTGASTTDSPRQVEIVCPGPNTEVVSEKKEEMAGVAH